MIKIQTSWLINKGLTGYSFQQIIAVLEESLDPTEKVLETVMSMIYNVTTVALPSSSTVLLSSCNSNKMGGPSFTSHELLQKNSKELSMASEMFGVTHALCVSDIQTASSTSAAAVTYDAEALTQCLLVWRGRGFDSTHLGYSVQEFELRTNVTASMGQQTTTGSFGRAEGPTRIGTGNRSSIPSPHLSSGLGDARDGNCMLNASYTNLMKHILSSQCQGATDHAQSIV
eukprot:4521125-Ditylum_brightwellii.AAC.1